MLDTTNQRILLAVVIIVLLVMFVLHVITGIAGTDAVSDAQYKKMGEAGVMAGAVFAGISLFSIHVLQV